MNETAVREALSEVIDPELGLDVVALGLVRRVGLRPGVVDVVLTLTTPACPLGSQIVEEVRRALHRLDATAEVSVELELDPPWTPEELTPAGRRALGWS